MDWKLCPSDRTPATPADGVFHPMKKLGLGVLGLGEGRSIISGGLNSSLWRVVTLCDVNEALGRERLAEFSLPATAYTKRYEDMLADPKIDVIGIYTPDHLHAEHVLRALEAGKHVICTKPFIDSLAAASRILAAVEKSGRHVMVGQSSRHFAPFARQREHFEKGVLGELVCVEACYNADHRWFLSKPWAKKAEFKWLYGGLSHPVDFVRWYLPRITEVAGYSLLSPNGRKLGLVHADTFQFVMRDADGRVARVSGAYSGPVVPTARDSNMSCVLRGTKGASQGDYYDLRYAYKAGGRSAVETFEDQDDYYFRFGGHSHHAGEYQNYLEYFARCLAKGVAPKPDATEGILTVALMQAMDEAAEAGRSVKVREVLARHRLTRLLTA
jgi:predicted dehydrogenase